MGIDGKNSGYGASEVLVLADFSDGSWHAITFAMEFLYNEKSPFSILQTYQKPKFGLFMFRNLLPHLKEITIHELKTLKNRILKNYKIKPEYINTLSLRGNLTKILRHKIIRDKPYSLVLGTHGSFAHSCTMQNQCLAKIIDSSNSPLFILPQQLNPESVNNILVVGNPSTTAPPLLMKQVISICRQTEAGLNLLFVVKEQNRKISEKVIRTYKEYFEEISYTINYALNSSVCKGMEVYLKNNYNDLIIVERLCLTE